jgi:prevent-host-death family protein
MSLPAKQVNVHEAKTHLSRLLSLVGKGEEVVIARGNRPVARLVPAFGLTKRFPGSAKAKLKLHKGFEKPLPKSILKEFEG